MNVLEETNIFVSDGIFGYHSDVALNLSPKMKMCGSMECSLLSLTQEKFGVLLS